MTNPSRILVVDDELDVEPLVLQRMRREIRKGEFEFEFAHNGIEALDVLNRDDSFDVVLSDINMPEMDGLTLLEQIPSVNPNIRSVIVSAYGDMKNIRTAMNRGAFDFITKPIDFEDLRITINRTVRHLRMWREALTARDHLISIQNELSLAQTIQQSILPTEFMSGTNFSTHGIMEPAKDIGGDFFDIIRLESDRIGIAVADVSDKGVPSALFMMSSRTSLKVAALGAIYPEKTLHEVNNLLNEDNQTGTFVTVFYGVFDCRTGVLEYANGGHNPPLLVHADGSSEYIKMPGGMALAVFPDIEYDRAVRMLKPGDKLLVYTDGITEAMNIAGEMYGEGRLQDTVRDIASLNVEQFCNAAVKSVKDFAGDAEQSDDITCLALHWDG